MTKISVGLLALIVALNVFSPVASAADADAAPATSGFLPAEIEAKMKKTKLASGREIHVWLSSELNRENYKGIMIDRVAYYPAPNPGPQISSSTLDNILEFTTKMLRDKLSEKMNVVDVGGPGVVRLQAVITAVESKEEGLTALDVIPVHFLFSAAKSATGNKAMNVTAYSEMRITDSVSGDIVGAAKGVLTGEKLKNSKQQIELESVQKSIEVAAEDGAHMLDSIK